MLVSTTNDIPGHNITKHIGLVRGITVRSRSVLGNFAGGVQSIFGGKLTIYVELAEAARQEAYDHLVEHATKAGANAVIGMRYDANEIMDGITEVHRLWHRGRRRLTAERRRDMTLSRRALARGETTSRALVEASLEAIARDPRPFTDVFADEARAAADAADRERASGDRTAALAGLPISVKDLFDIEGRPTLAGTPHLRAVRSLSATRRRLRAGRRRV